MCAWIKVTGNHVRKAFWHSAWTVQNCSAELFIVDVPLHETFLLWLCSAGRAGGSAGGESACGRGDITTGIAVRQNRGWDGCQE